MLDRHYDNFNIAGFTYYDGVDVFDELKIGTELQFVPEPENKFDESAVALYYKEYKLGYVPKGKNCELGKFLKCGHTDLFEIKINRISSAEHPEQQVSVVVKIKDRLKAEKANVTLEKAPEKAVEKAPEKAVKKAPEKAIESAVAKAAESVVKKPVAKAAMTDAVTEVRVKKPRGRAAAMAKARAAAAATATVAAATTASPQAPAEVPVKKTRGRKLGSKNVKNRLPAQPAPIQTPPAELNTPASNE
jgi:hypothetical protein